MRNCPLVLICLAETLIPAPETPNQAIQRLISAVVERLHFSDRVVVKSEEYGITMAVGAGYTLGAYLWRWLY